MITVISFEVLLSLTEASPSSFLYTTVPVTRFRQPGGSAQRSACSCVSSSPRKHTNVGGARVKARVEEINIEKRQASKHEVPKYENAGKLPANQKTSNFNR